MKELKDEEINLIEYDYNPEDRVEFPGYLIYSLIQILSAFYDKETQPVFLNGFQSSVKQKKNSEGALEQVDVEWQSYPTAASYFNQKPVNASTVLGAGAQDLLLQLKQIHLNNIKSGVAKQVGGFTQPKKEEDNAEIKLA